MRPRPLILIHGYSADEKAFYPLHDLLTKRGLDLNFIDICRYISLNNEITIQDIAEGLGRAFRSGASLNKKYDMDTCKFDAIVHSTGMLVLRPWPTDYGSAVREANPRLSCLKHRIGWTKSAMFSNSPEIKKPKQTPG